MGVIALFSAIALLAFLPWLDSSPVKSAKYRPVFRVFFWAFVIVCLGLGWLGSQEITDAYVLSARILAICYFAFFLIVLPLLGLLETTKPLPASIADAVLARTKSRPARTSVGPAEKTAV